MEINVSDKAKDQLRSLDVNESNFLRLWVEQGGCHGMTYQAAIDTEFDSKLDQTIFTESTLRIVADNESAKYFTGLSIDYSDDLVKSGFRFINPNASSTCGCGSSFTS